MGNSVLVNIQLFCKMFLHVWPSSSSSNACNSEFSNFSLVCSVFIPPVALRMAQTIATVCFYKHLMRCGSIFLQKTSAAAWAARKDSFIQDSSHAKPSPSALQWANVHRSWRAEWQQVVFSDESRFNLWHHDGRNRVTRYASERHIPECIIERHNGRTPGVKVWGAIAYHGRSQLLRIVGNINSTRYINEVLQPQAIPFLQGLPGALFQQDNARPHVAKTVKSYLDSQQVQPLPWPAYSPVMSPIEHMWDIVGRRFARYLRPVA
ncbi:transposable element Tcb1 transposase [Trichonephila clavipes]|nr:transposable element Tcb1 transposase [Trichonephila clavipes]